MSTRGWYLVAYDVRDDARLRRTAKLLEGYGERVQYSVFRCHLSTREEEKLRWDLTRLLVKEDGWLIVPVCESCIKRLRKRDTRAAWPEDPPGHVII
ncbi:MAG: CRISPR-associated endonuclease Cas2 [Chloroflexota bacterium]|nr:MAG: CRISPR-associated endonuclease Cas2 [Chloroflexota bacterium]